MRARIALAVLAAAGAGLSGALATAAATAARSSAPCAPRVGELGGRRAIAYCGPAAVTIALAGRTYVFRGGLCDRSRSVGALALNVGTLVAGAGGNAGKPFVGLVIARSPSSSEAFEADAGGRTLFGDTEIVPGGSLLAKGTFNSELGTAFSGSWDCHGLIVAGP